MNKIWKVLAIAAGSLLLLAVLGGVLLFGLAGYASAQESSRVEGPVGRLAEHFGPGGFPGGRGGADSYLAEALGISVEELQAAQEEAAAAALDLAVEQGLLTEEQAQALESRGFPGRLPFGHGLMDGPVAELIDPQALLAEALGISVEELAAAQQEAQETRLAAAVEVGLITTEQAELIQARQALRDYLDREALQAQALGISVEELQAYREAGASRLEILDDLDLTVAEVQQAYQAAFQEAVAAAVAEGIITQEQADLLAEMGLRGGGLDDGFGPGRQRGPGGRGGHGFPGFDHLPETAPATTTETGLGA